MKFLLFMLGAVIASVVISGLVLPRDASAEDRTLTLFGRVEREFVPDGHAELAFNFYDKDTKALVYRSVSTAVVKDGAYSASVPTGSLEEGKEYYVLATLPAEVPESFQEAQNQPLGIVLLQPTTPGIQQVGHANINGTLIAGAIQTGAFRMSTGAAAGRVLTSDASGNGTWQDLPPPSGTAGGDLAGTYPNPLVAGLQGRAVASTAPTSGQVLKWTGSAWAPGTDLRDEFWQRDLSGNIYYLGRVDIGRANGSSLLHVSGGLPGNVFPATNTVLTLEDDNDAYLSLLTPNGNERGILFGQPSSNVAGGIIYNNSATPNGLQFRTNGNATRMVIDGSGNVGIGTNDPAALLSLGGSSANTKLALWQGTGAGDLMGFGIGPEQFRLHLHNPSNRFSFLNAPIGSELLTILGTGNVGIGTNAPQSRLHVETGGGAAALRVVHTATSGHVDGVKGIINTSTTGAAVSGEATATSGTVYGVYGQSNSASGYGVAGFATATSGATTGVWGRSDSTSGAGVAGYATATSGISGGVYGEAHSSDGRGVVGYATATSGTTYGVLGRSDSTSGYGVLGVKPAGGSGYGVYYLNGLAGTGTKSFQMDHPLMPETHYLNHFCTEGPEPYNAYSGNVVTDAKGYATVQLPDYFENINRDFRYQLTVINEGGTEFVQAMVVRKIQNNQFVIRTSMPHVEVSWRVEAVRNDRWVQEYGFQTEQEKPKEHLGKYLHPELFGMPKEYGIHYRADVERRAEAVKGK